MRRSWYRRYLPGWIVTGGGGGSSGTVTTDNVTIQGNGSGGSPIAIKAVQTDATLTGAGTVASPLSAVQQTPIGWPLKFYANGVALGNHTSQPTQNSTLLGAFFLDASLLFSQVTLNISTADGANNTSFGIYNSAGTRVAHTNAAHNGSSGHQTFAWVEGSQTIAAGNYFFGVASASATFTLYALDSFQTPYFSLAFVASSGGAMPASISAPSFTAISYNTMPEIALW